MVETNDEHEESFVNNFVLRMLKRYELDNEEDQISAESRKLVSLKGVDENIKISFPRGPAVAMPSFQLNQENLLNSLTIKAPEKHDHHKVVVADVPTIFPAQRNRQSKSGVQNVRSRGVKRSNSSSSSFDTSVDIYDADSLNLSSRVSDSPDAPTRKESRINYAALAALARPKIEGFFEEFWDLDFDDSGISGAFFGRITEFNYLDFGLRNFENEICNLLVIKNRIDSGHYSRTIDLKNDFELMFDQIISNYPDGHAVIEAATSLRRRFKEKWASENME